MKAEKTGVVLIALFVMSFFALVAWLEYNSKPFIQYTPFECESVRRYEKIERYYIIVTNRGEFYGREGKWFEEKTGKRLSTILNYDTVKTLDGFLRVSIRDGRVKKISILEGILK